MKQADHSPDLLIRGARLIDPAAGVDARRDLLAREGRVALLAPEISHTMARGPRVIDAEGLWLLPGLVDPHVHFRDPGFPEKETLASGARAAAAGGYTTVICEPNTAPPIASLEVVQELARKARREACVRVYVKAAMTRNRAGEEPADLVALGQHETVVAFSDDGDPVVDPDVMEQVCRAAALAGLPISPHCEDSPRALKQIAEGLSPGFDPGQPYTNEARYIARDALLAARCGCRAHFSHVSLPESLVAIAAASPEAAFTCEVTPHHLLLCRDQYAEGRAPKVCPPLRSAAQRDALRCALISGKVACIASDHAPHSEADKQAGASGFIGLETTLGLVLTHLVAQDGLSLLRAIELMSTAPARIFGLEAGSLAPGMPADVALVDPDREWTVRPSEFQSLSANTPYAGRRLRGKAVATYVAGREVYADPEFESRT